MIYTDKSQLPKDLKIAMDEAIAGDLVVFGPISTTIIRKEGNQERVITFDRDPASFSEERAK